VIANAALHVCFISQRYPSEMGLGDAGSPIWRFPRVPRWIVGWGKDSRADLPWPLEGQKQPETAGDSENSPNPSPWARI
jgi:hypothetical protein